MLRSLAVFLASIAGILLLAFGAECAFSNNFQHCIAGDTNPYGSNPPEKYPPTFQPGSTAAYVECTGGFVISNSAAINALATILIAAFTATLWVATSHQAQLTKETLVADKKAFVYADGFPQTFEPVPNTALHNWRFRVGMKNTGDTPAKDFRMYSECEIRNSEIPLGHIFKHDPAKIVRGFVAPRSGIAGGPIPLPPLSAVTPQDIADVQSGTKYIYIWGWIWYFDVFPGTKEHVTKFCWRVTPVGDPFTFVPHTPGLPPTPGVLTFNFTVHPEHNSADDD